MTYTTISEQEWRDQFRPHQDEAQTAGLVNYGYQTEGERRLLEQANAERRLWTYCLTSAGNYYITQGWSYVNREFYVICDVPVPEGIDYDVESEEMPYCEICGDLFGDGEFAPSSVDPSQCHHCYTNSMDEEERDA
jgi:hypothetical protein